MSHHPTSPFHPTQVGSLLHPGIEPTSLYPLGFEIPIELGFDEVPLPLGQRRKVTNVSVFSKTGIVYPVGIRFCALPDQFFIEEIVVGQNGTTVVEGPMDAAHWAPAEFRDLAGYAVKIGGSQPPNLYELPYVRVDNWGSFHRAAPLTISASLHPHAVRHSTNPKVPSVLHGFVMVARPNPAYTGAGGFQP